MVQASPEHPILVDGYLTGAVEIDVDAVADGEQVVIGGIMEHIEEAGIHSGDSSCSLPPYSLGRYHLDEIRRITRLLAMELNVKGLMNLQLALKDGEIFVLEVNPRASRTIPFVSKAIGAPLAKIGARVMAGKKLKEIGFTREIVPLHVSVKEAVFPFIKFPGVDVILGPEMKSTGEVMGIDLEFGPAFLKSQVQHGFSHSDEGKVFLSVADQDKSLAVMVARRLQECGFSFVCTEGTANALQTAGIDCTLVGKVHEEGKTPPPLTKNAGWTVCWPARKDWDSDLTYDPTSYYPNNPRESLQPAQKEGAGITQEESRYAPRGWTSARRQGEVDTLLLQGMDPVPTVLGRRSSCRGQIARCRS